MKVRILAFLSEHRDEVFFGCELMEALGVSDDKIRVFMEALRSLFEERKIEQSVHPADGYTYYGIKEES